MKKEPEVTLKIRAHLATLVQLRETRGLTQKECADKLKINSTRYSLIEQCRRAPWDDEIEKISKFFRVDPDEIFTKKILQFSKNWGEMDDILKEKTIASSDLRIGDVPELPLLEAPADPHIELELGLMKKTLQKALDRGFLRPREFNVLCFRHGLDDGISHTLDETGRHMGVTRERIRQLEAHGLEALRVRSMNVFNI